MILVTVTIHNADTDWPAWIQALTATVAAIGLIWTLNLQKKSTDAQVAATLLQLKNDERDYNRYLKEIVPVVNIGWKIDESREKGHMTITIRKNPAYNFHYLCLSEYVIFKSDISKKRDINIESPILSYFKIDSTILLEQNPDVSKASVALEVFFSDEVGNNYKQKIAKRLAHNDFHHYVPEMTKNGAQGS